MTTIDINMTESDKYKLGNLCDVLWKLGVLDGKELLFAIDSVCILFEKYGHYDNYN